MFGRKRAARRRAGGFTRRVAGLRGSRRRSRRCSPPASSRAPSAPRWSRRCSGMIRELFAPEEMGKAYGILGPVAGLSAVAGPIVSGLLVDADILGTGWRAIFLVNLPVGAFVVLAGAKYLPSVAPTVAPQRLDGAGMALAAAGTFLLIYPLVQGHELGWPAWTLAMLAASLPVLAAFGVHQLRRNRAGAPSLVETSVFAPPLLRVRPRLRRRVRQRDVGPRDHARDPHAGRARLDAARGAASPPRRSRWAPSPARPSAAMTMHKLGRKVLQAGLVFMAAGLAGLFAVLEAAGDGVGALGLHGAADHRRHRAGHGLRADVRHRARRRGATTRWGRRRALLQSDAGARHVARRRRDRDDLLRRARRGHRLRRGGSGRRRSSPPRWPYRRSRSRSRSRATLASRLPADAVPVPA